MHISMMSIVHLVLKQDLLAPVGTMKEQGFQHLYMKTSPEIHLLILFSGIQSSRTVLVGTNFNFSQNHRFLLFWLLHRSVLTHQA